jgi:hypothetical protein
MKARLEKVPLIKARCFPHPNDCVTANETAAAVALGLFVVVNSRELTITHFVNKNFVFHFAL